MSVQKIIPENKITIQLVKIASVVLILLYLLNCFSPLRLHVDTLRYFAIKDCIEIGCSPDSFAATDYLPYGYTALLLLLSKIGLLHSFTIIFINCIYLFFSIYFILKIFGKTLNKFHFIFLLLLNWTIIKFTTHPLSELQFLFFSTGSIYFFTNYTASKKIIFLIPTFLMGVLAFITRSVGITLIAALTISLFWQYRTALILLVQKNKIISGLIILVTISVLFFSKQLGLDHYTDVFTKQFKEGVHFMDIVKWHLTEWSEISLNLSIAKVNTILPFEFIKYFFIALGMSFYIGFMYFLLRKKSKFPCIIKVYALLYSLLMFNWPFYDPRFWLPILPIAIAVILQSTITIHNTIISKLIIYPILACYIIMGFVSVSYMTYTSLNKEIFAKTQANGVYRNEYETIFFNKPSSDTATVINKEILSLLKRHN